MSQEQHVEKIMKLYNLTKDKALSKLWPDFDINEAKNHEQVQTNLANYQIDIDIKLSPLLERINSGFDYPITDMSCQHGWFGQAGINFTYPGFFRFYHKVRNQYIARYGTDEESGGDVVGFYRRIVFPKKRKSQFKFSPQLTCDGGQYLNIGWDFRHTDIGMMIYEYDELFNEPKSLSENHLYVTKLAKDLELFKFPQLDIRLDKLKIPCTINLMEIIKLKANRGNGWKTTVVWNGINSANILAIYELKPNETPPILAEIQYSY